MSAPAIVGAGGDVRPPCRMRAVVRGKGRSKPMTSTPPRARRDTPRRAGRTRGRGWVSREGAVVLQGSGDLTVKTVQQAADLARPTGSRLDPDSASSDR